MSICKGCGQETGRDWKMWCEVCYPLHVLSGDDEHSKAEKILWFLEHITLTPEELEEYGKHEKFPYVMIDVAVRMGERELENLLVRVMEQRPDIVKNTFTRIYEKTKVPPQEGGSQT